MGEWTSDVVEVIQAPIALNIEYKVLGSWEWDGSEISYDETDRAINLPNSFLAWKLSYKIGALLTYPEKKWLREELIKKLQKKENSQLKKSS